MSTTEAQKQTGRVLQGIVVSDKMDKTVVVRVDRRAAHPVYQKVVTRSTKFHVHDEENTGKDGDKVLIQESRPISKTKAWKLIEILGDK